MAAPITHTEHPVAKGLLVISDNQYGPVSEIPAGEQKEVEQATIWPPRLGWIMELYAELSVYHRCQTADNIPFAYSWQARTKQGTWVTIASQTPTTNGATWMEHTVKGRASVPDMQLPMDLRLLAEHSQAGKVLEICTVSKSYLQITYRES